MAVKYTISQCDFEYLALIYSKIVTGIFQRLLITNLRSVFQNSNWWIQSRSKLIIGLGFAILSHIKYTQDALRGGSKSNFTSLLFLFVFFKYCFLFFCFYFYIE